jgi:hypothetical protein
MTHRTRVRLWLVGAALTAPHCDIVFPPGRLPAPLAFRGCFRGTITEPAGGELTIILDRPADDSGLSLSGCAAATVPVFQATLAGMVLQDQQTQARLTAMSQGRPAFVLLVERQGDTSSTTLTVVNESQMPFRLAPDLPRCAAPTTCADLGITQPFASRELHLGSALPLTPRGAP